MVRIVLPSETLNYFSPVRVEQTSTETHIHLDERMPSALSYDVHFESKGFIEAVSITGFPIRDPIRFVLAQFENLGELVKSTIFVA